MELTFLGHSAMYLKTGSANLLIDPFLTGNPQAPAFAKDLPVDFILVTHAHGDHLGDTVEMAKAQKATVITTNEIAVDLAQKGIETTGMHLGGKKTFSFGSVKLLLAFHGSGIAGGHACGFLVETGGKKIYFAGDTALYGDMKLLKELWGPIDVALLPIGSHFTMDADDAAVATRWIEPKVVIPIHYNTFPPIQADVQAFKNQVESEGKTKVVVLLPGASYPL